MFNLFSKCIEQNNYKEEEEEQKSSVKIDTLPYFTETMDPYISIYEGALSEELCDNIIKIYAKNKNLHFKGVTLGGENPNKKTTDLSITVGANNNRELKDLDRILKDILTHYMEKYVIKITDTLDNIHLLHGGCQDTGYHIQVYKKGQGLYRIHTDDNSTILCNEIKSRVITFIWYLNDVTEGGETAFINKCKIKPKKGNLLIFPSTWTYPHCGMVPISHDKYIITGWMYMSVNNVAPNISI